GCMRISCLEISFENFRSSVFCCPQIKRIFATFLFLPLQQISAINQSTHQLFNLSTHQPNNVFPRNGSGVLSLPENKGCYRYHSRSRIWHLRFSPKPFSEQIRGSRPAAWKNNSY